MKGRSRSAKARVPRGSYPSRASRRRVERRAVVPIALLVLANAFVGAMVGIERAVLPLLAEREFGVASVAGAVSFIATFGVAKAAMNLAAGSLADRHGRRRVLLAGWLVGLPVPVVLALAPRWEWVLAANVLLGVNQALCWSMTLNMKLDLAGARRRGLVTGLNEFAGYGGLALAALASGAVAARWGLRPAPFLLGVAIALVGLAISAIAPETRASRVRVAPAIPLRRAFREASWSNRTMSAASLAGHATNLKDGALWGLLPGILVARGLGLADVAVVVAAYPAAWGLAQVAFGPLSDHVGRKALIVPGLALQAAGVVAFATAPDRAWALAAAIATGLGTAMAYPTLLALVADASVPAARASHLGVYRAWRDLGYAVGALAAGLVADAAGASAALTTVAIVVLAAGVTLAVRADG